jgi:hypothetical protein
MTTVAANRLFTEEMGDNDSMGVSRIGKNA